MIELERLTKKYDSTVAVDDLTLDVARGELLVLLGGSGCGKTTTLKLINRLVEPSSGTVRIGGADTRALAGHELRRRIGYCFQEVGLFPHMTVGENVAITLDLLGWSVGEQEARVRELLSMLELEPSEFAARWPHELSGGQRQRVGIARALAAKPEILLLDEPFGALDPLTRDRLQQSFQRLRRELGVTGVFVTHDMVEALLLGDRIAVMQAGRLAQVGRPQELLREPANDGVAELMETPMRQTQQLEVLAGRAHAGDEGSG
ncbi:MAG: ATP-binding cassette domain-containing protein [Deltaproteobacteria bacterium]|nr:ATP-binding cassette domain-containing protein [Deltaproteobacteria bacterium]MBW2420707.1 ATP-binding cassette domain-containing protein [Deltaproteobacteria bacterium]